MTDVKNGQVVFKGGYEVDANGRKVIARIHERNAKGIFKISYTGRNGETFGNHYLYGKAPFNLEEYRNLLTKTGLYEIK